MRPGLKGPLLVIGFTALGAVGGLHLARQRAAESTAGTSSAAPPRQMSGADPASPPTSTKTDESWFLTRESPQSNSPGPTGTSPPAARPAHPWSPDEEELARLIIRQNENWLYVRDAQGNFLKGPDGRRVLTPLGQRYAAYVAQALDRGIRSPTEQHHFALTKLAAESQAAEAIVKHPPLVTAMPDARAYPNLGALRVAVFADGVFCEQVAQDVLLANRIVESKLDAADVILVVVRDPLPIVWLRDRYDSPAKLKEDVKRQLNLAGDKGHVLVYWIEPSLQVKQVFAGSEDWETLELIRTRRRN